MDAVRQESNRLILEALFAEDVVWFVRVDTHGACLPNRERQRVHRLVVDLGASVDDRPRVNLNSHRSNKLAFELVGIDKESHLLDRKGVTGTSRHREMRGVLDDVSSAIRVR